MKSHWTPEAIGCLGKESDGSIASSIGISRGAVTAKRNNLGILAHKKNMEVSKKGELSWIEAQDDSLEWKDIAQNAGYPSPQGARTAALVYASRHGLTLPPRQKKRNKAGLPKYYVRAKWGIKWGEISRLFSVENATSMALRSAKDFGLPIPIPKGREGQPSEKLLTWTVLCLKLSHVGSRLYVVIDFLQRGLLEEALSVDLIPIHKEASGSDE